MSRTSVDQTKLSRALVQGVLFLLTLIAAVFVVKSGSRLAMAGLIALPFALMLLDAPRLTLVLSMILNATDLPLPGNIASTKLGFMGFGILAGIYFLGTLLGKPQWKSEMSPRARTLFKFYGGWLIILMAIHGSGLKIFGSATWGGTRYIANLIAITLCFVLSGLRIDRKHINWILYGSVLAGVMGSFLKWKGYEVAVEDNSFNSEIGQSRLQFLLPIILVYFPFVFAIPLNRLRALRPLLILIGFCIVGFTGFRSRMLSFGMVTILFAFSRSRAKGMFLVTLMIVMLGIWGGVVAVAPHLPEVLQRSVSFVPGVHIASDVALDAATSIEWRIEIWKYCLARSEEYFLLGKGLAFNVWDVVSELSRGDIASRTPWFAYQTHAYHSGPLTLFIDLGLPGLVVFFAVSVMILKTMWRFISRLSKLDTVISRFALFHCIYLFYSTIHFYFIYGDFNKMAELLIWFAIYSVIARSVLGQEEQVVSTEIDADDKSVSAARHRFPAYAGRHSDNLPEKQF